jgi:hypothetical protein
MSSSTFGPDLGAAIAIGRPGERKAAIEALVTELRVMEEGVIPMFRIPGPRASMPGNTGGGAKQAKPVQPMK